MSQNLINEDGTFPKVNTPMLIQMEKTECGAASLGIIFWYYGAFLPLEKLRIECGVTRDGSNAYHLVQTAKKYHFECQSYFIEEVEDLRHIRAPFIIHWDFNHFVVVEGIEGNIAYLNDPSYGKKTVSLEDFSHSFTGVVIALAPDKNFKPIATKSAIVHFLKEEMQKNTSLVTFLLISGILLIATGLLLPGFSKIFIDDILLNDNSEWFAYLILGMVCTAVIRNVLSFFQQKFILNYKIDFVADKSGHLIWHLLHLPITFFQQRYIGDIAYRAQAFQRISGLLTNNLCAAFINLFSIVFYWLLIVFLFPLIGFLFIIAAMVVYYVYKYSKEKIKEYSLQFLQLSGTLSGIQVNGVQSIEMIKATSGQEAFFNKWASTHAQVITAQQKLANINQYTNIIVTGVTALFNVLILTLGALFIMRGELSAGTLVAVQSLSMSLFEPILTLFNFSQEIEKLKGDFVRVNDLLVHRKETYDEVIIVPATSNKLTLNQVTFGYSPFENPIISNFSLECRSGEKISIVGPSGSGKSTVAKLAVRLLLPQAGNIRFNDTDVYSISAKQFKHVMGYVDQEILLFEDTLRANLTLHEENITDDQIYQALEDADILEFVKERGGLELFIEEGGKNLSLGQRQRIEIARTLLFEPKILIMDEATSYLDPQTESKVLYNIKARGCGLIIITHRLSAVYDSDKIIVLQQGIIQGMGTHESLMENNHLYARLYKND